jgi:hypothetical protein
MIQYQYIPFFVLLSKDNLVIYIMPFIPGQSSRRIGYLAYVFGLTLSLSLPQTEFVHKITERVKYLNFEFSTFSLIVWKLYFARRIIERLIEACWCPTSANQINTTMVTLVHDGIKVLAQSFFVELLTFQYFQCMV